MLWIICYDIADDRRRNRIAKKLEGYGERVQDSVFECHLDPARLRQLQETLAPLVNPEQDHLRYYPLCRKDQHLVTWRGYGQAPRDTVDYIL